MGSYHIWPCHVTQAENLSFPYLNSYSPLDFRNSHQISWSCCIPNGSYKEVNMKEGRICPLPCGIRLKKCQNCRFFDIFLDILHKTRETLGQEHVQKFAPDFSAKMTVLSSLALPFHLSLP